MGALTAPLVFLGLAAFLILFNVFGLETALAARLLAHYQAALPVTAPVRPLPLRLVETFWLLAVGGGAIWLLRLGILWAGVAAMGGIGLSAWTGWVTYLHFHRLFDAASVSLALLLLLIVMVGTWALSLWLARMSLRLAFADSLPAASIEKIVRRPELLKADGEVRDCTYLVCGVRGLAGLGADFRSDPAAFTKLMQRMLSPLMDQALQHGGTIDRLTADGFAAFWNAPLDDPSHATHACEAASGMAAMAARVNDALMGQTRADGSPLPLLEIGVGVATGPVIAGAFGGHGRMGYSVNGEAVTLATRIQALSHQYGPAVIVADATRAAADRSFAFLEVDTVAGGAGEPPVTLFAILGNPVLKASPKFRALTTFHDHIFQALRKQQWRQARALIEQCRKLSGASPRLYDLHLNRIGYYESSPPGENWDGAFRPILK
ncbi:MAG: adenylate/guanylate cyclase domain-containing protein [Alphaproteobacteria bacterium]|nr:adenylate/guanylate cyclase domain-containing protein [Alphaproteobacteria bacterium]